MDKETEGESLKNLDSPGSCSYLSTSEVYFLWYFMQGSIMSPITRQRLRNSWGFCQRHMLGWLLVESAFFHDYLHGPSILMADLIDRASYYFKFNAIPSMLAIRLRNKEDCMMCSLGYNLSREGFITEEILVQSKDISHLLKFARYTENFWLKSICSKCFPDASNQNVLCRPHLIDALLHGNFRAMDNQIAHIQYLSNQISAYSRSFQWEWRGTETKESKASLISSACWLKGWNEFIHFYNKWQ